MKQIAVDIVLLPEPVITNLCVEVNQNLVKAWNSEIKLHAETGLPHISLAMGHISNTDLPDIQAELQGIWAQQPVPELHVTNLNVREHQKGAPVSSLVLEVTSDLQNLHETIMQNLNPFLKHDPVQAGSFLGKHPIAQSSLDWVTHFRAQASFENFWPHITLGYGALETHPFPDTFQGQALALCHLGNHCTCQKVLYQLDACTE